jgi:hypothetical protein
MQLSKETCELLSPYFGKYYDNVSLERIDGVTKAVHFTGVDYKALHPTDTECDFCYVRQIGEGKMEYKDFGGCIKTPYMVNSYKFVAYSKNNFNSFTKLQQFVKVMQNFKDFEVFGINSDSGSIYSQETGGGKNIKVKNIGYISIDFQMKTLVDTCNIENC